MGASGGRRAPQPEGKIAPGERESERSRRAVLSYRFEVGSGAARDAAWTGYVTGCRHGDQTALARLYDESCSLVYSIACRVVGNDEDAEEVTLDVYTQVWRTAAGYDPERGTVTAWLATMARSRAIDKVRSRSIRVGAEQALEPHFELSSGEAGPEDSAVMSQQRRRVRAALEALNPDQRRAIELAYFSGLTNAELAAYLGEPLGTVKTRIRLGMMKLRELLVDYA